MSSIVQFTFIVSISICPCIKINADAVGLHVTQVFTEPRNCYFYGANCVVYEAFPFKCLLRSKLQTTTLVRDANTYEMEIIIHQMQRYCLCWYVENYGKLGRWYFTISCVRLQFFSSSTLFLSCRKCYKKRDIQTLGHVSGVIMRVGKHVHGNSLLFLIKLKIISFLFRFFWGLVLKAGIFGKMAISGQLGSVEEYDYGGSNSSAEVLTSIL